MRFLISVLVFLFAHGFAWAELVFEERTIEKTVAAGADSVDVVFKFKNTGDATETITAIRTNCSCTIAELEKKVYKPDESGEIKVHFDIGERIGFWESEVYLKIEGREDTWLTVKMTIPEILTMNPRVVTWNVDDELTEKTIELHLNEEIGGSIKSITPTDERLEAKLSVKSKNNYLLTIKPTSTGERFYGRIKIMVDMGVGKSERLFNAYVTILPKKDI